MSESTSNLWFDECYEEAGSRFGLKVTAKLHEETSKYQRIEIYNTVQWGHLMVIDGCMMLSARDNFLYHEMMTHPALFTHHDPKHVAIIGGGDCGSLREVLKHTSVAKASQIDIDERVTRLAERYFPDLCESNDDSRAELLFEDGIKWMQARAARSLDVIIIDSTDPVGPAEGLFAVEFYKDCHAALNDTGVMVQQTESPLLHGSTIIQKAHNDMKAAGFNSVVSLYFPQPVYPSGWWTATLAIKGENGPTFREQDAANKAFDTKYYNADIHRGALAQPEFMRQKNYL